MLGSCRGLILINLNQHIQLWNLTTRFYTKVLELDNLKEAYYTRGGLCFDSSKNVYKAVLIMQHQTPSYGDDDNDGNNELQESVWDRLGPFNKKSEISLKNEAKAAVTRSIENEAVRLMVEPLDSASGAPTGASLTAGAGVGGSTGDGGLTGDR
ncbi:hypothetical protein RND71_005554 [Anisodus tanguticus]|uniref:Uncharacterized protein n=1 Tax=Anisodus tanguticus TaxID=243964 RepID=A0AAE1SRR7_9SOLA|nr:hypothetical protein RND71_005554 [Anisodus tanguticus]